MSRIEELEKLIAEKDFWNNKKKAQEILKEYREIKQTKKEEYPAIINIVAGTGGLDAEDFVFMLFEMYKKYLEKNNFKVYLIDKNENSQGGYKNISIEVDNKKAYSLLKNESGVHRLVRVSPFNAKNQRHTSFALVDVIPKLPKNNLEINDKDIDIKYSTSSGPGGQNVNKRETAVIIKHEPTKIIVRVERERSQLQNKELALEILRGKLFKLMEEKRVKELKELSFNKGVEIKWGNQIRNYVIHPYQLVKDLRTNYEDTDINSVFNGNLQGFIDAF